MVLIAVVTAGLLVAALAFGVKERRLASMRAALEDEGRALHARTVAALERIATALEGKS